MNTEIANMFQTSLPENKGGSVATQSAASRCESGRSDSRSLRVLIALPGLHRVNRGAEVAFESIAQQLGQLPGFRVTVIGSGTARLGTSYEFRHAAGIPRERFRKFPTGPLVRHECMYEELAFVPALWRAYTPDEVDVTVTCSYPYMNWLLRVRRSQRNRPLHVYVTQNGDWPIRARSKEYRFFGCDGLVCTNPEYYEAHRNDWPSALIPNGVDETLFTPGVGARERFGLPKDTVIALMVSAIIPSKRIIEGICAAATIPDLHLVVAGQGPLQGEADETGRRLMGSRYRRLALERADMPALYRSCDVLLHMSQVEPSSLAYIEALATGLPIVTHDRPVTRWTLEDKAILVDTNTPERVAEGIKHALLQNRPCDQEARRELVMRRYSWSAIAAQYGKFFYELIAKSN